MNSEDSLSDQTSSEDPILDDFMQRLDQTSGDDHIESLVEEFTARHPERAAEFRRLVDGLAVLRGLRDPERLGPYRIRGVIGVGGMGKVYEAEEDELNRIVAVKTIKPGRYADERLLERFDRERKALARFHHTHIVPIFATGREQDLLYFVMPRIQGASLSGVIRTLSGLGSGGTSHSPTSSFEDLVERASTAEASERLSRAVDQPRVRESSNINQPMSRSKAAQAGSPAFPPDYRAKVVRLMIEVAEAVHHAHQAAVIHRVLKPSNIFVERSPTGKAGRPWVLDFGLAVFKAEHAEQISPGWSAATPDNASATLATRVVGTYAYMAPEQLEPAINRSLGAWTDVYALGATLYELLALHRVVDSHETIAYDPRRFDRLRQQVLHESPVPPSRLVPGFPRELEAVCLKALEKSPERRYASARELADDLGRWLEGRPTRAGKAGPPARLAMLVKRYPAASAAVTLLILLILSILGTASGMAASERQRAEALHREKRLIEFERVWSSHHSIGWSRGAWDKIRELRGTGPDPQLQGQAAATLEGLDAKSRRTFPGEGRAVSWSPDAGRLLMVQRDPSPDRGLRFRTTLWDSSADRILANRDLGDGVLAFRGDGTPFQLSRTAEAPSHSDLFNRLSSTGALFWGRLGGSMRS